MKLHSLVPRCLPAVGLFALLLLVPDEAVAQCEICNDGWFEDWCGFCDTGTCYNDCNFDPEGNCYNAGGTCNGGVLLLEDVELVEPSLLPHPGLKVQRVTDNLLLAWNCQGQVVGLVRERPSGPVYQELTAGEKPAWVLRREAELHAIALLN